MRRVAGIPLNPLDETKHIKLIGTTGTGKSTAIREILGAALERGDRAIIADPDGGYASRFYDERAGDVLPIPSIPEPRSGTSSVRSAVPTTSSSWPGR